MSARSAIARLPLPRFSVPDDAGAADALRDLVEAELAQLRRDEGAGARLLEAEFGMGVEIAPPGGHLRNQRVMVERRHRGSPSCVSPS